MGRAAKEHCQACSECRAWTAATAGMLDGLHRVDLPELPVGFEERIHLRLASQEKVRKPDRTDGRVRRWTTWPKIQKMVLATGAVMLVVLAMAVFHLFQVMPKMGGKHHSDGLVVAAHYIRLDLELHTAIDLQGVKVRIDLPEGLRLAGPGPEAWNLPSVQFVTDAGPRNPVMQSLPLAAAGPGHWLVPITAVVDNQEVHTKLLIDMDEQGKLSLIYEESAHNHAPLRLVFSSLGGEVTGG